MILKEEMKARSAGHDNDQWGSRRSSRCCSREALNNVEYGSLNGCESVVVSLSFGVVALIRQQEPTFRSAGVWPLNKVFPKLTVYLLMAVHEKSKLLLQ